MEVLSQKYPGIILICQNCGCLMGNIKPSDIYANNLVYCPLCKFQNILEYNKNYDGIITEEKKDVRS